MKSRFLAAAAKPGSSTRRTSKNVSLPAPIKGWVTAEGLASTSKATAQMLDNILPTTTGVRLRGGSKTHATVSLAGLPVISMMSFNAAGAKKLFAATATAIFDITTVVDPSAQVAAAVTGQTSGYYSFSNFTTSGGSFLTAVNGTDSLRLYDPTNGWRAITGTSTPAITGAPTNTLSHVWVYRTRQFFIQAGTLKAYALPVASIAGNLITIDLNGVFQRGGSLLFGDTWSMDTGDGLDDKCVFVTDQGEMAVYEGSNPADNTGQDWRLAGRYDITPPMGKRAIMRAGGDLLIACEEGIIPTSAAVSKDAAALSMASITRPITPDWRREAVNRRSLPWEIIKWPAMSYAIVSLPITTPGQEPIAFVVNTETGAWCRYRNWDIRCMVLHDNRLYFGTNDGRVKLAEIGGNDDGAGIYYTCVSNPEHLGDKSAVKNVLAARATYVGSTPYIDKVSVSTNYQVELPSPPPAAADISSNDWDTGSWDDAVWDGASGAQIVQGQWTSIGRTGYVVQYQLQITGGLTPKPDTEFVSIDLIVEGGGVMV